MGYPLDFGRGQGADTLDAGSFWRNRDQSCPPVIRCFFQFTGFIVAVLAFQLPASVFSPIGVGVVYLQPSFVVYGFVTFDQQEMARDDFWVEFVCAEFVRAV